MPASTTTAYETLLRRGTTFIDVRAPVEFAKGAVPGALNLPILTDDERAAVGTVYRKKGQAAAIELGMSLVSGEAKRARIASWAEALGAHNDIALYCWRGGLRSKTAQSWIADAGHHVVRVEGGFKALRNACRNVIEEAARAMDIVVVSGRTGSGKTLLLHEIAALSFPHLSIIDLEGRAHHRGSAFGRTQTPQPSPVDFENALAVDLLQLSGAGVLAVEDESRLIGRAVVPDTLFDAMGKAPIVVLERTMDERVAVIFDEYVHRPLAAGDSREELGARLQGDLARIKKRLGDERFRVIDAEISHAFSLDEPAQTLKHRPWIEHLLTWYYDPQYDYQLSKKQERVIAKGDGTTLIAALKTRASDDHPTH